LIERIHGQPDINGVKLSAGPKMLCQRRATGIVVLDKHDSLLCVAPAATPAICRHGFGLRRLFQMPWAMFYLHASTACLSGHVNAGRKRGFGTDGWCHSPTPTIGPPSKPETIPHLEENDAIT
jgi:hypothetical protein